MTQLRKFRISLAFFIIGLVLSGISAFPLLTLTDIVRNCLGSQRGSLEPSTFFDHIHEGLVDIYGKYPWIGYGTDWLGFGHLVIALFFIGPFMRPDTSRANLICGIIACFAVIPFAMIAGEIREIPIYWRLVDCSFGVVGLIPLLYCLKLVPKFNATS